jgi:2-methylaconitate cis-trans-isomerase PrpF
MPLMVVAANALGLQGNERPDELDTNHALMRRIEALRLEAGRRMGLGDVSDSVVPKPVVVSRGDGPFSVQSRYFTPHHCHAAHAVTGAIAVASSFIIPGTVTHRLGDIQLPFNRNISVIHPAGRIEIALNANEADNQIKITRAGVVRTARRIMKGSVFVPSATI